MARIDDYINAKKIAVEKLSKQSFVDIIKKTGFKKGSNENIQIPFLNRVYSVSFPDFQFADTSDPLKDVPIQEQVLILHYILGTHILTTIKGEWIAYREIPGASFYFSAFIKRAVDPLKKVFGNNIAGFIKAAALLKGKRLETGNAAFEFNVFPKVPLRLIIWEGDEEFPAEANILFDRTAGDILSPEDVAWLSGMLVYRLMAIKA